MKKQIAKDRFNSGLNCAQTILTTYTSDFNFDEKSALSIACGFGAGMGRMQKTCGAVTGSFMVLGLYNYSKHKDNPTRKEETYKMIQEFNHRFIENNKTTECRELLKCNLNTEEGEKYAKENNVFTEICEKCIIVDCVEILNDLINDRY